MELLFLTDKRAAFSSAKNTAKKVLSDVVNIIDKRRIETGDVAFAGKSAVLSVEKIKENFKSPKRVVSEKSESKNERVDDFSFTSCRCSSDMIGKSETRLTDFEKLKLICFSHIQFMTNFGNCRKN